MDLGWYMTLICLGFVFLASPQDCKGSTATRCHTGARTLSPLLWVAAMKRVIASVMTVEGRGGGGMREAAIESLPKREPEEEIKDDK